MTLPTWTRLAEIAEEASGLTQRRDGSTFLRGFEPEKFIDLLRAEAAKEAQPPPTLTYEHEGQVVAVVPDREPKP